MPENGYKSGASEYHLTWALNQGIDREEGKRGNGRVERYIAERNVTGLITGG